MKRREQEVHAYHDGELSLLRRRWVERRLARDPAARAELRAYRELGEVVREIEAEAAPAGPDLWPGIAGRLPEPGAPAVGTWSWPAWLSPRPLAAGLVAVAATLAVVLIGLSDEPEVNSAVRWLDSGGKPVMVLSAEDETTIIWVLDPPVG